MPSDSFAPDTGHGATVVINQIDAGALRANSVKFNRTVPPIDITQLVTTGGRIYRPAPLTDTTVDIELQYDTLTAGSPITAIGTVMTIAGLSGTGGPGGQNPDGLRVNSGTLTWNRAMIRTSHIALTAGGGHTYVGSPVYEIDLTCEIQFDADDLTEAELNSTTARAISITFPGTRTFPFDGFIVGYNPSISRDDVLMTADVTIKGSGSFGTILGNYLTTDEMMVVATTALPNLPVTVITVPGLTTATTYTFKSLISRYGISFSNNDEIMTVDVGLQVSGDIVQS